MWLECGGEGLRGCHRLLPRVAALENGSRANPREPKGKKRNSWKHNPTQDSYLTLWFKLFLNIVGRVFLPVHYIFCLSHFFFNERERIQIRHALR